MRASRRPGVVPQRRRQRMGTRRRVCAVAFAQCRPAPTLQTHTRAHTCTGASTSDRPRDSALARAWVGTLYSPPGSLTACPRQAGTSASSLRLASSNVPKKMAPPREIQATRCADPANSTETPSSAATRLNASRNPRYRLRPDTPCWVMSRVFTTSSGVVSAAVTPPAMLLPRRAGACGWPCEDWGRYGRAALRTRARHCR